MAHIEQEIDSRLPYRIGCPKLPVLPVETKSRPQGLEAHFPNFDHHKSNIRDLLAKYDIPLCCILFVYRVNPGVDAADRYLTIVLESKYEHGCQDRWINAVKEIRSSLVQSRIYWTIELIDQRVYLGCLYTAPILSTDRDLIEGWSKVLPDVLTTIENRNWVAIDVLRRQFPSREMRPTVIISAQDANDDALWDPTIAALSRLLQANNLTVDIVLLFLKGINLTMTSSTMRAHCIEPDFLLSEDFYWEDISMGSSCATSGSTRSGTLGGRIKLQKESSILELGLTSHHVLKDGLTAQGPRSGPFPPDLGQMYETAVSPSDQDHETTIQGLKKSLPQVEKEHKDLSQELECLPEDDPIWERKNLGTEIAFHKHKVLEGRLKVAETYSRYIGCVYAASGFRTCEAPRFGPEERKDWALNWGLVKLDQGRSISCQLQNVPSTAHHFRSEAEATQYCTMSPLKHYKVMKRGRTTGWTQGTLSAIDSTIRIQDHDPVFVHAIVGTRTDPCFLQPGDSGSLILLDQASNIPGVSIVGLGFASNDESFASYMIPMDLIVKDIERVTDATVIEPQYAGEAVVTSNS